MISLDIFEAVQKSPPYFVLPSDSEASLLTSFGTSFLSGDTSADASGRQQEGSHKNIFSTASGIS